MSAELATVPGLDTPPFSEPFAGAVTFTRTVPFANECCGERVAICPVAASVGSCSMLASWMLFVRAPKVLPTDAAPGAIMAGELVARRNWRPSKTPSRPLPVPGTKKNATTCKPRAVYGPPRDRTLGGQGRFRSTYPAHIFISVSSTLLLFRPFRYRFFDVFLRYLNASSLYLSCLSMA